MKCIIRDRRFEKCLNFVDSVLLPITTGCDDDLSGSGLRGSKPASIAFEVRQVLDRRLTIDIFQVRLVFSQSPELGLERTRIFRTSNQPNTRFMFQNQTLNHETLIRWQGLKIVQFSKVRYYPKLNLKLLIPTLKSNFEPPWPPVQSSVLED